MLDRTPPFLLHEIILVDDHSDLGRTLVLSLFYYFDYQLLIIGVCVTSEELKEDLDRYVMVELQGKVKVVRNQKREGLIRGRMIGASRASGMS